MIQELLMSIFIDFFRTKIYLRSPLAHSCFKFFSSPGIGSLAISLKVHKEDTNFDPGLQLPPPQALLGFQFYRFWFFA